MIQPSGDPVVTLVDTVVRRLEAGRATSIRDLVPVLERSFGTCQRLHLEARHRGYLNDEGYPTEAGLLLVGVFG